MIVKDTCVSYNMDTPRRSTRFIKPVLCINLNEHKVYKKYIEEISYFFLKLKSP